MGYVYIIKSTATDGFYIGKTILGMEERLYKHKQSARFGSDTVFGRAIRKYGEETFYIEALFQSDNHQQLLDKEVELIAEYKAIELGWNINLGGDGRRNRPHIQETIEKMSEAHRQTWASRTEEEKHRIGSKIWESRRKNGTESGSPRKKWTCPQCGRSIMQGHRDYHIECHKAGRL